MSEATKKIVINVKVEDKIARNLDKNKSIVCGNSNYEIAFQFDEEWQEYNEKTAIFICDGETLPPVVFQGDKCPVPILTNTYILSVGVTAGDMHTTTDAIIKCRKSIRCKSKEPKPPAPDVYAQIMQMINDGKIRGEKGEPFTYEDFTEAQLASLKGADGNKIGYLNHEYGGSTNTAYTYDSITNVSKVGDYAISKDGKLIRCIRRVSGIGLQFEYVTTLKGADGKDGKDGNSALDYIFDYENLNGAVPAYDNTTKTLKPSSITDNGKAQTPHLDISFGKANEIRKAFFEQSLLLGDYHYGNGFIQDKNGNRMLMPNLSQNETMATESGLKEVFNTVNTGFGYYGKTGADRHEIKCNGLYIVFANNADLKICKADGTAVISGAQQLFIMTTPYNGFKSGSVFIGMGMYIYKSSFSITNLKIPVEGIQVELDDGSYITAGSANTNIYISQMVKGNPIE